MAAGALYVKGFSITSVALRLPRSGDVQASLRIATPEERARCLHGGGRRLPDVVGSSAPMSRKLGDVFTQARSTRCASTTAMMTMPPSLAGRVALEEPLHA